MCESLLRAKNSMFFGVQSRLLFAVLCFTWKAQYWHISHFIAILSKKSKSIQSQKCYIAPISMHPEITMSSEHSIFHSRCIVWIVSMSAWSLELVNIVWLIVSVGLTSICAGIAASSAESIASGFQRFTSGLRTYSSTTCEPFAIYLYNQISYYTANSALSNTTLLCEFGFVGCVVYLLQQGHTLQYVAVAVVNNGLVGRFLANVNSCSRSLSNVNSRSRSLYAIARPSVCRL